MTSLSAYYMLIVATNDREVTARRRDEFRRPRRSLLDRLFALIARSAGQPIARPA